MVLSEKALSTSVGAGLLASIAESSDFHVLAAVAVVISTASYYHDVDDTVRVAMLRHVTGWFEYALAGVAVMFFTFYGLLKFVPDTYALPQTVYLAIAGLLSGYGVRIIRWSGTFLAASVTQLRDKFIQRKTL